MSSVSIRSTAALRKGFNVEECKLGQKPASVVNGEERIVTVPVPDNHLTFHWLENYREVSIVFGFCRGEEHLAWMMNRVGDKSSDMYNLRADRRRHGCVDVKNPKVHDARFLILYFESTESDNVYRAFRIRKGVVKNLEWMISTGYPIVEDANNIQHYYCYYLEEEVSFGKLNVGLFLTRKRLMDKDNYIEGAPIFATGEDVLRLRVSPIGLSS